MIDRNENLRIGVVLSSGGGRGVFAHTGFLQAIEQLQIEVSAIAGCSAGALVGGIYASGTQLSQWADSLTKIEPGDYWTPDPWWRFVWQVLVRKGKGYTGISDNKKAIQFIRQHLSVGTFEECRIPFYCLAFNLSQSGKTLFDKGELAPCIMASAAIPILYRPVEIEGEWFSDGAAIELAPTDAVCCKQNLDILIVHHTAAIYRPGQDTLTHALSQSWSMLELLYMQFYKERPWYISNKPYSEHLCPCGCGARVVVLEPDLPELSWPFGSEGVDLQIRAREQALELLNKTRGNWKKSSKVSYQEGKGQCS